MSMQLGGDDSAGVMAEINVTPMVDVMLVLLIIFMVVTPAIVAGFQAQLPQGEFLKERPEAEERVVLGIDANGRYYLKKRPIAREDAECQIAYEFATRPQDRVLFSKPTAVSSTRRSSTPWRSRAAQASGSSRP